MLSRGVFALLLDGFLVPFCSKCIDACMRANIGKVIEIKKLKKLVLTARRGQSGPDGRMVRHTLVKNIQRHGCLWWKKK